MRPARSLRRSISSSADGTHAGAGEAFARPRPRVRRLDATTARCDDGSDRGFVSAVSFRDVDFRFAFTPRRCVAELEGTNEPAGRLDSFADADDAAAVLTHPLDGYFTRPDRRLGRYTVWHERLRPQLGVARHARYAVFEELGLVAPGAAPHSLLLQRSIEFDVLLPPTRG